MQGREQEPTTPLSRADVDARERYRIRQWQDEVVNVKGWVGVVMRMRRRVRKRRCGM